jgi:DHA1 family tetracycline resistance protein-like MFS transporter
MQASSAAAARPRAAAMRFIMITVLIDMMSIGLIIPVLPSLVGRFVEDPTARSFWYTMVILSFALSNFFGASVMGALSDRFGRRPVLLVGFCGVALVYLGTALSTQLWQLIVVRLLGGALQGNVAAANAYVADISTPQDRARNFGMLGAMFGLGFILGPVLGGVLGRVDLQLPFYVAGTLGLVNLAYGMWVLPESLPPERRRHVAWRRANPFSALSALVRLQGVKSLVAVLGLAGLAQFILHLAWVPTGELRFGWGPFENGMSLFAVGVLSVLVQGVLMPRLLPRWGAVRVALTGLSSGCVAYVLWGLASQGWMAYGVMLINLLGFSAMAALQALVSNAADADVQGETMGALSSLNGMMTAAAPLIGGPLLTLVSHYPAPDWRLGAPFFLCAALQLAATLLAFRHFAKRPETPVPQAAQRQAA